MPDFEFFDLPRVFLNEQMGRKFVRVNKWTAFKKAKGFSSGKEARSAGNWFWPGISYEWM